MHPHRGVSSPSADFDSIADLMHDPKSAATVRKVGGGPDCARQWIGDLTVVVHLANDLIVGDPHRQCPRPAGMGQRVSGQFADREYQIADLARRQSGPGCPGGGELPDASQASLVPEHLGAIRWLAQRPAVPGSQ